MREIKFRGKKKSTGEWVYGYYYRQDEQAWICNDDGLWEVEQETIGQLTSLKDKNGKEIYAGDILETNGVDGKCLWLIEYEYSGGMIGFSPNCISGQYSSVHNEVWDEEIEYTKGEIIGNIPDNPELLKGEIK